MHHFGVKIPEFSPGGAGETFTIQRQQTYMMQNKHPPKSLLTIVRGLARPRIILLGISGAILLGVVEPGAATL